MSDSWKFVFVRLYKDSNFCWFRSESDREVKGYVSLKVSVNTHGHLSHLCHVVYSSVPHCFKPVFYILFKMICSFYTLFT